MRPKGIAFPDSAVCSSTNWENDRLFRNREIKAKYEKFQSARLKLHEALKSKTNDPVGERNSEQNNLKTLLADCKHACRVLLRGLPEGEPLESTVKIQFKTISERYKRSLKRFEARRKLGSAVSPETIPRSSNHVTSLDDSIGARNLKSSAEAPRDWPLRGSDFSETVSHGENVVEPPKSTFDIIANQLFEKFADLERKLKQDIINRSDQRLPLGFKHLVILLTGTPAAESSMTHRWTHRSHHI